MKQSFGLFFFFFLLQLKWNNTVHEVQVVKMLQHLSHKPRAPYRHLLMDLVVVRFNGSISTRRRGPSTTNEPANGHVALNRDILRCVGSLCCFLHLISHSHDVVFGVRHKGSHSLFQGLLFYSCSNQTVSCWF